jgi:hypothetical protein
MEHGTIEHKKKIDATFEHCNEARFKYVKKHNNLLINGMEINIIKYSE